MPRTMRLLLSRAAVTAPRALEGDALRVACLVTERRWVPGVQAVIFAAGELLGLSEGQRSVSVRRAGPGSRQAGARGQAGPAATRAADLASVFLVEHGLLQLGRFLPGPGRVLLLERRCGQPLGLLGPLIIGPFSTLDLLPRILLVLSLLSQFKFPTRFAEMVGTRRRVEVRFRP